MPRKYDKGEYVNVIGINRRFLGVGKILGWEYYPENKTYDYLILNTSNQKKGYFEEGHLENLKINLARENKTKMENFYFALKEHDLRVKHDHNERKKTYTLVGKDLDQAKKLFDAYVRGSIPIPSLP